MWLWMDFSLHPHLIHTIHPIQFGFWLVNLVHLRHTIIYPPYTYFTLKSQLYIEITQKHTNQHSKTQLRSNVPDQPLKGSIFAIKKHS